MPIYFLADDENQEYGNLRVKIGHSGDIQRRVRQHQTGSPKVLKLMGIIHSRDDRNLEKILHKKYREKHSHLEWFNLSVQDVYEELRHHSTCSYIVVNNDPFEVVSHDKDGVPELVGAWQWMDVDNQEFCPQCGWGGGLSYNINYGGDGCLSCGFIVNSLGSYDS